MKYCKTILFPTDFSVCADAAYKYALLFANIFNSELHVFHAIVTYTDSIEPEFSNPYIFEINSSYPEKMKKYMDIYAGKYGTTNSKIFKKYKTGYAIAPTIVDYVKKNNIDLVIMGTHGRRGVRHMFLGSVAEEMLRMSPRPVITIRKGDTNNNIPKHILIPFDFSKHAQKTLLEGCDIAHKVAARLTLLHVIEFATLSAYLSATNEVTLNHIYKTITEDMKNKLYDIVNKSGIGKDCKIEVILGHVASSIIKYASSNKVDLIVMGSLGYSGLTHFLLGSTTEKILRSATCPVMTVKPSK